VASRSARAKRWASFDAFASAVLSTWETATHDALPTMPRLNRPGPTIAADCTTRKPIPSQANVCLPRVEVIVSRVPLAATYQLE
jgi:hypothetical protein